MRLVFRPEAQEELLEAKAWYEACADGLGMDFARAFESALLNALRRPEAHPVVQDELRGCYCAVSPMPCFTGRGATNFWSLRSFTIAEIRL